MEKLTNLEEMIMKCIWKRVKRTVWQGIQEN